MKSKFITGGVGVGKTHMAEKFLEEEKSRWEEIRQTFAEPNWQRFEDHFKFYECPTITLEARMPKRAMEIIKEATKAYMVVLDDLGMSKTSSYNTDIIYIIINKRWKEKKLTIVTSNLTLKQISELIDDRLTSRLSAFELIEIIGKDKRLKK